VDTLKTEPSGNLPGALPRHPSPTFDVRLDVEANSEPFMRILAAAQETAPE
jgi:hypothetical protein